MTSNLPRTPPPPDLPRLTFGMVPMSDGDRTRVTLADFCAFLGENLRTSITPHRAPSPAALASAIQSGRVQLAWLSPTLLVASRRLGEVMPLVSSVREGVASYHAALFVPDTSPVQRPEHLARARAAWVAPTSAAGYIFSRLALARRGLDLRALFGSEAFHDSHGGVAYAVLTGDADVGATFAVYESGDPRRRLIKAGFSGAVPGRAARIIDVAGPIPADMIVAVKGLAPATRVAISLALQRLAEQPAARAAITALFGAEGFQVFSPGALPGLRSLVDAGRDLGIVPADA